MKFINYIKITLPVVALVALLALPFALPLSAFADSDGSVSITPISDSVDGTDLANSRNPALDGAESVRGDGMPTELIGPDGIFTRIVNTVLYAIGIISIVMIIWGGLRYILSGGDAKKVTDAKNTLLYAIIGLIIALISFAIVNFVIGSLAPTA